MNPLNFRASSVFLVLSCSFVFVLLSGCSKADPVPVSECKAVVSHAKRVLGDKAPSSSQMLKQCKAASDEARGCVMAADKPMKLLDCDFQINGKALYFSNREAIVTVKVDQP